MPYLNLIPQENTHYQCKWPNESIIIENIFFFLLKKLKTKYQSWWIEQQIDSLDWSSLLQIKRTWNFPPYKKYRYYTKKYQSFQFSQKYRRLHRLTKGKGKQNSKHFKAKSCGGWKDKNIILYFFNIKNQSPHSNTIFINSERVGKLSINNKPYSGRQKDFIKTFAEPNSLLSIHLQAIDENWQQIIKGD